jgi:hypothetical protein
MAVVTACVGAAVAIGGSLVSANQSKQAAKGYRNEAERKAGEIAEIEANRQSIPNPYANVKDLSGIAKDVSGMAKDLSGMISNPFANLGVSTQAAKMQAEEADISLANTLDTIRATGASAGGATALAQAALQSKKGVAASIEQQEGTNEKLRAQGAATMQEQKMAESQRLQGVQMSEAQRLQGVQFSEGQRMQAAETEGIKFKYGEQESRDIAKLNRLSGQEAQQRANQAGAKQAQGAAVAGGISAAGSIIGGAASAFSDRRLKRNINRIGISLSGINIYSFEYIDSKFGDGIWQGVMSDEINNDAVIRHKNGYDMVDYSLIDVEFKKI